MVFAFLDRSCEIFVPKPFHTLQKVQISNVFDPNRHLHSLNRAKHISQAGDDFLMQRVVEDMLERLGAINRTFDNAIALFGRTEGLATAMRNNPQIKNTVRVEEEIHVGSADHIVSGDNMMLEPNSVDLVLAPFGLHWINDLPGALVQLHRAIRPDGLLMAILPGPDTLQELRDALLSAESEVSDGAAMRVDPFTDIRDAGSLLQRTGFALPVVDRDDVVVRYSSPLDLVADLRKMGANSQLSSKSPPLNRQTIAHLSSHYSEHYSDADGRLRATFSLISMSGWVPHESQQKPLKPGSAKTRMADALKVDEVKLKP